MNALNRAFTVMKQRQQALLLGLVVILATGVMGLLVVIWGGTPTAQSLAPQAHYSAPITRGTSRLDPKEVWMEKTQSEYDLLSKRQDTLEKTLHGLYKYNGLAAGGSPALSPPADGSGTPSAHELQGELRHSFEEPLGERVPSLLGRDSSSQPQTLPPAPSEGPTKLALSMPVPKTVGTPRPHTSGIQKLSLNLVGGRKGRRLKTGDNTIPAGAFAQCVLLGGVDASTSIQASGDPRPILLRVTDTGTLPRRFRSDLCGCHVLAASYGDISSERVFMRLEKLTCTERKTGELVEMNVQGYVAGEDGRAGLRGTVVDRAGASMRNAAVGGFLSGMGSFLSQSHNSPVTYSLQSGLAQSNPLTNGDILKHGAAKGATNALEKYADFYIKRAEQMQPIIQVEAGRVVDIVFTHGTSLEDSAARSALIKVNDTQRLQKLQGEDKAEGGVTSWLPSPSPEGKE
jgi:conjugal transfer pilus assembly protein TraB